MLYFKHRGTEIQSFVFLKFNEDTEFFYKTQRYKGTKFFFRYKYNKQLKSCHETLRTKTFVAFISSLAALCIFL